MKIKVIEASTNKPLQNLKVQLQIKGKESGFLSITTDQAGTVVLDDKYKGHQVSALLNGIQGAWITAAEGVTLTLDSKRAPVGGKEKKKETWE